MSRPERFVDPGLRLVDLADEAIDVVCPRCAGRAASVPRPTADRGLTCGGCGYARVVRSCVTSWGGPVDPFFGVPLWLRAACCGHELWAFHRTHLDLLADHVGAKLRERSPEGGLTLPARLPGWITAAGHRDEVLRTIARLRATLDP